MSLVFVLTAALTIAGAVAAAVLKNLVHCALSLTITFAGLALMYLELGAQFAGFAQSSRPHAAETPRGKLQGASKSAVFAL